MGHEQQGTACRPPLLTLAEVMKLTDAAQSLFGTLYDLERAMKRDAKAQVAAKLGQLDLFGLTVNKLDSTAKEYRPDERRWSE